MPKTWNRIALVIVAGLAFAGCSSISEQPRATLQEADRQIAARLQTAIQNPSSMGSSRIEVDVREGVVELTGYVPTQEDKDRAGQIAAATPGVKRVENRLTLPTGRPNAARASQTSL